MSPPRLPALGCRWLLALPLLATAPWAAAWEMAGVKTLSAHTTDGQRLVLGTVQFTPREGGAIGFIVALDHARFTDHFLSMKEFKCLSGPKEIACHVPYPYPQPGTVTAQDLSWLEHSLLFLYKQPTDFGAKLWNGLYYRFQRSDQGLVGRPQAVDLNRISAPPDQAAVPPYRAALRDEVRPGSRWIETLLIE